MPPDALDYAAFKALMKTNSEDIFPQDEIIERFETNTTLIDKEGMCFGISHMAISAFLADDFETFSQRLKVLNSIPKDLFPNVFDKMWELNASLYNEVKEKKKVLSEETSGTLEYKKAELDLLRCKDEFSELHSIVIGIDAFLAGISLYQKPGDYSAKTEQPIFSNDTLAQASAHPLVRTLVNPVAFDNVDKKTNGGYVVCGFV